MNKRHLHHLWRQLQRLSYWYFLIAFILSGAVFVFAYRGNNLTALHLREQLLSNDKAGTQVEQSLDKLRGYIYSHMNASLSGGNNTIYPPIQLTGTYQRLVLAEQQRVDAANAQVSRQAQDSCSQQYPGGKTGYLLCIQNYEADHAVTARPVPDALYKFDFVAPRWSPDLAGWSLVFSALFLLLFMVRLILEVWLRYSLRAHQ